MKGPQARREEGQETKERKEGDRAAATAAGSTRGGGKPGEGESGHSSRRHEERRKGGKGSARKGESEHEEESMRRAVKLNLTEDVHTCRDVRERSMRGRRCRQSGARASDRAKAC